MGNDFSPILVSRNIGLLVDLIRLCHVSPGRVSWQLNLDALILLLATLLWITAEGALLSFFKDHGQESIHSRLRHAVCCAVHD